MFHLIRFMVFLQICFSVICLSLTKAFAYQNTLEKIKSSGVLTWGFDAEGGAPYVFHDLKHSSKLIGFEVELVEAIARELGVKVQCFQNVWDSILLSLQRGDFDIALNGIEITPVREQSVLFTRPYYVYAEQIVVRAADNRINSIDAVFVDLPIASYYAMPNPQLRLVGKPAGEGYYGIAVRKEDTALAEELNKIIEKLLRTGELKKIYGRWGLWNTAVQGIYFTTPKMIGLEYF